MTPRTKNTIAWVGLIIIILLFTFCGRYIIAATEPLNLDTKTHKVVSPLTIDFGGVTILNWPISGMPAGGTTGQVLTKNSSTNYDASWKTPTTPTPAPTPPVTSVFTRTGAITAQAGDYAAFYQALGNYVVDPTTTKGDLIVRGVSTTPSRLGVGANGTVLTADSGQPLGMSFQALPTPTPAPTPPVTSVFTRTGAITAQANDYTFVQIGSKPTTLAGYGITDAELSLGNPPFNGYVLSSTTGGVRSWISAGGTGTVTSFGAGNLGPLFTTSVSNATTTPLLSFSLSTAANNQFLGYIGAGSGAPSYQQIPFSALSGVASTAQAGVPTGGTVNQVLAKNSSTNYDYSWVTAAATGVTNVATTSPITGGPITGTGTIGFNAGVNLNLTALQTMSFTDAGTNAIVNSLVLDHNSSATPVAGFGAALRFQSKSDTTSNQHMGNLEVVWTNPAQASRTSKFMIRPQLNGVLQTGFNFFGSTGLGVGTTTDPGTNSINLASGGTYQLNGTNIFPVSTTNGGVPTAGTVGQVLTKNTSTNFDASWQTPATIPVSLENASVANQTSFATDTYLNNSNVTATAGSWTAGGQYHVVFDIAKTAFGTATPILTVRFGTAGTTSDTAVGTLTFPAGTAVVDTGTIDVWVNIRTTGTSATLASVARLVSSGGGLTGGTTSWNNVQKTTGTGNTTTATALGVSFNGGTAFQGTVTVVQAEYKQ